MSALPHARAHGTSRSDTFVAAFHSRMAVYQSSFFPCHHHSFQLGHTPQKKPLMESHATFTTRSVCCDQAGGSDKWTKTGGLTADEYCSAAVPGAIADLIRQHHAVRARHAIFATGHAARGMYLHEMNRS